MSDAAQCLPTLRMLAMLWRGRSDAGNRAEVGASVSSGRISVFPSHSFRPSGAKLTPAQIAEAQRMAREWKPTK
jgi:hypothetical protein